MKIAAVTGTNGKSSTIHFARQILEDNGARVWTITNTGVREPDGWSEPFFWCREQGSIKKLLRQLKPGRDDVVLVEAYSIALSAGEWKGMQLDAAAFTSFGQDHMDVHGTMAQYFAAKRLLFSDCVRQGGHMIVHHSVPGLDQFADLARQNRSRLSVYQYEGVAACAEVALEDNLVCASQLVEALGGQVPEDVLESPPAALPGRLEAVPNARGIKLVVDYAHNPAGLVFALTYMRRACDGRLVVVLGCGGERDTGKRQQMGEIADALADKVIVCDDNPRSEDPAAIRAAILSGCAAAREIPSRRDALTVALQSAKKGDGILAAGMGSDTWPSRGGAASKMTDRRLFTRLLNVPYELTRNIS